MVLALRSKLELPWSCQIPTERDTQTHYIRTSGMGLRHLPQVVSKLRTNSLKYIYNAFHFIVFRI